MPKTKKHTFSQRQKKQINLINAKRSLIHGKAQNNFEENSDGGKTQKNNDFNVVPNGIICGDFSQFSNEFPLPHTQCTAMAIAALAYAHLKIVTSWNENDLNIILREGQNYFESCLYHTLIKNPNCDSTCLEAMQAMKILKIETEEVEVILESEQIHGGPYIENNLVEAFRKFEQCQFQYCVFTYLNFSFGLVRLETNGISHYAFFDSHGRSSEGKRNGSKSAILFFENFQHFTTFFSMEYPYKIKPTIEHDLLSNFIMVPLYFITHDEECIINKNITSVLKNYSLSEYSICTRIVSGHFAQNDIRFDEHYRDRQSTANSVVFLAYVSLLKENFLNEDIDSILVLGNHIYTSVIKKKPKNYSLYYLNEMEEEIDVCISRLSAVTYNVLCQPLIEKEYSNDFKSIRETMEQFFQNHFNGILNCSSMSIALHKSGDEYLVFDSRARSVEGFKQINGNAHTFFFSSIASVLQLLCRFGLKKSDMFSLTPFNVTFKQEINIVSNIENNNSNKIDPIIHTEIISPECNKEIKYEWDSSDDIPLIDLKNSIKSKQKVKEKKEIKERTKLVGKKEMNKLKKTKISFKNVKREM